MTSDQAESYIKERAAVEESIMKLRLKYFPVFRQVLSGKATALFCQIDWLLGLIMDLQLTRKRRSSSPNRTHLYAGDEQEFRRNRRANAFEPIAFEHYRIHVIELWPDGPRKEAGLD